MEFWMTFHILAIITPTDFHSIIFHRGRAKNRQPEMLQKKNGDIPMGIFHRIPHSPLILTVKLQWRLVAYFSVSGPPCPLQASPKQYLYHRWMLVTKGAFWLLTCQRLPPCWWLKNWETQWEIFRTLKWSYCTKKVAILCGDIIPEILGPETYGRCP